MFYQASAFNQDLSEWDVAQVTDMDNMFNGATYFDQVLCGEAWLNSETNKKSMFEDSRGTIACEGFKPKNRGDLMAAIFSCLGL